MLSFTLVLLSAGVSTTYDGGVSNSYGVSGSQYAELKETINEQMERKVIFFIVPPDNIAKITVP